MSFTEKRLEELLELLPALYRLRDAERDEPLKALLSVIAEQVAMLDEDLDQLYDDQFIETCAEWVIPYIGDLVGTRGLYDFSSTALSRRAQVGHTIGYRRRKGTASVLEQLARDVTNWPASVVEYFQLLATTQYLNHLRPDNISFADLRDGEKLVYLNGPFDSVTHSVDVRRIETGRGKYNIPHVGIFLWRFDSYPLDNVPAFRLDDRRYLFHPAGRDTQLFSRPEPELEITHLAEPINVPMPIMRDLLDRDLEREKEKKKEEQNKEEQNKEGYYGLKRSLLLRVDKQVVDVSQIVVCNLEDKDGAWAYSPREQYGIDPVLGRISVPTDLPVAPKSVQVSFSYGFSDAMGGGPYGRVASFDSQLQPVIKVPSDQATIQEGLNEVAASGGVVEIEDDEYHVETPVITVAGGGSEGKKIELRAADAHRHVLVLDGDLFIEGGENSEVTLNGILICGGALHVLELAKDHAANKLRRLRLRHCTLLPGPSPAIGKVAAKPAAPRLRVEAPGTIVEIDRCIVGGLRIAEGAQVRITNSIIDASEETEVAYAGLLSNTAGGALEVRNSTIIGKVHTINMELASNTIFLAGLNEFDTWAAPVLVDKRQEGCVRFSYLPTGARTPRQYNCHPQNEDEMGRVRPILTSRRYGDAGYCQLSVHCPVEICQGADDEAEMGAFHDLYQPQRVAHLRARLDEYLRFGLEAGIFYAT